MRNLINALRVANPAFWYFLIGGLGSIGTFIYILAR